MAAAANDDDDMLVLQPKSFAPLPTTATATPSPKSIATSTSRGRGRNNIVSDGKYSQPSPKSVNASPATPRTTTSTKLGLSLRRITPAVATPSPSPRARRLRGGAGGGNTSIITGDGQQSTTSASLVSRITGGGRSKYSIATGATPVMRGGGTRNNGSGGNPPALKKRSVDQRQRLEDEYYRPSMHWEEEDEDDDAEDDEDDGYEYNDYYENNTGELPRLTRVDSIGNERPMNQNQRTPRNVSPPQPSPSAAAAAAAAAAADMPTLATPTNHEQLKVAGFWSQLDDNGADDDSSNDDIDNTDTADDNSEEEMPGDERHWRQSVSPSRRRRRSLRNRFGRSSGGGGSGSRDETNDASIGLDLVRPHDSEEEYDGATASKSQQQPKSTNDNKNGSGGNNWNLLEKAACFANEKKTVEDEDDESSAENTSRGGGGRNTKTSTAFMEDEDEDQSLDRTFQSSYTGARTRRGTATNIDAEDEEENTVLACITGALATICGYEAAENLVSPNKKRAHDIIDKRKNNRSAVSTISGSEYGGAYYDDDTNMTDEEDAAIELQYHHPADQAGGGGGLSPRRKLAFKKLLSLGKKRKDKDGDSPPRKTLVTTTTRSGVGTSGGGEVLSKSTKISDLNSSLTFEQEILGITDDGVDEDVGVHEDVEEEEGEEEGKFISRPAMGHNDPIDNKMATIDEGSSYAERPADMTTAASVNIIPNDDEELESEAAAWSTNKKNSYLRQLAERAKMEYVANAAGGTADSTTNVDKSTTATGVAVTAAAIAATAAASSRSAQQDDNTEEEPASIPRQDTGGDQASYNADYNTFSPAQKRLFLRLLNSGMSPRDAARRIAQESGGDGKHATTTDAVNLNEDGIDEEEGEVEEDDEIMEADERNVNNGSEMPSFSKMPSLRYPDDEGMPQLVPPLMSADPPADVLSGASGETAEQSSKNEDRENIHSVSRSEMAQDESRSNSQGRHAAFAAIPLVPALIRAKLRSKSKERKYPTLLQQDDDEDEEIEEIEEDNVVDEQVGEGQSKEAQASNVDGLLSSGIGYYDARGRGLDRNEEDKEFDDDNADSGLLGSEYAPAIRGRSQKHKFIGVAVASGVASKVASSRQVGVPRKRGLRYRRVDTSLSIPAAVSENDVDGADPSTVADDNQEIKPIKSPRPSSLNFMSRNPTMKPGSKQWSRLDSDLALDQVAPSRSVEVEDMPSWLVSRDDEEEEHVESMNEPVGEEEVAGGEDLSDAFVDSTAVGQTARTPMWSSSISPEMGQSQMRNVGTPTPPDSATSVNSPTGELNSPIEEMSSEAQGYEHQKDEEMPFPPPVSPVSPDEDATSMMDRSYASTMAESTWTSTSKSHRKRHKGAASKRILQAKEAKSRNKNKGWLDSIRDAASMQGQIWDPERGWVDYTEPEDHGGQDRDYFSPGSLHIVIPSQTKVENEESHDTGVDDHVPEQSTQEREVIVESDKSAASVPRSTCGSIGESKSPADALDDGDDTIFDAMTVNSAAEGMSVYSNSTAAPKRRAVPRHRPTDRRKIVTEHQVQKPIGWKESMENATANVAGRYWDYERGWVRADGTVDDDVSELTRSTLEGVRMSNQGSSSLGGNSHNSPVDEGDEEPASPSHLPSVAEEIDNADFNPVEDNENDDALIVMDYEDRAPASSLWDPKDDLAFTNQFQSNVAVLPSIVAAGSDKENEISEKEASTVTPPFSSGDQWTQPSPMSLNKRTLNKWLEKSNKEAPPKHDVSDVAAIMSNESMDSSFSNRIEDNIQQPLPTPFPFSDMMDSFGDIEEGAQEVEVVKEKCTDADSDLFEPSNSGISRSLINKLSGSISSRRPSAIGQQVHEQQPIIKSLDSQDSNDSSSWLPPAPPSSEEEHQRSTVMHGRSSVDALLADESVSSRAKVWLSSMEKRTPPQQASVLTEESSTTELESNAPQVNTAGTPVSCEGDATSNQKISGLQNLEPPTSRASRSGTRKVKKASDSWIQNRTDLEKEDEQGQGPAKESATSTTSYVGSLRSKFENKGGDKAVVITNTAQIEKPVFVSTNNGVEENDVYFRSTAMGIRLKRGDDGFVRVVSVTEVTNDSSIIRDGAIEPDDRIMEAAGVDLRNPISNNQWGETVTKIRNAPRPMKFVVAAGPKRDIRTEKPEVPSSAFHPPPAKYVMESRLSKSPEGQQVLESLSMARSYEVARAVSPPAIQQLVNSSAQTSGEGADVTVASRTVDDEETYQVPPKESLLKRIAAGCASPATVCTAPTSHHSSASSQHSPSEEGSQVPMAHLQFLRTNPTIARVANAASRRYPALCGRPDTIFEEPDDDDVTRDSVTTERSAHKDRRPAYGSSRKRSSSSKDDGSQTMATYSTYDDRSAPPIGATHSTGSGSMGSGGTGDNTEFLEKLALGSSLRSNITKPRRDNDTANATLSRKLGKPSYGLSEYASHGSNSQSHATDDDLEWPDDGEQQQQEKDTINDGMSTYISSMNHPSYLSNNRKNRSARQAELLAAGKVVDMMNELHNVDPEDECEI